jgi:non-specific serine/threonine protein kinase
LFGYNNLEIPADTSWPMKSLQYDEERNSLVTILRNKDVEMESWRMMSEFGLKRDGERFILRQKVSPVDFLLRHLPKMQASGYEVFGEESLKNNRVNRNTPRMRMSVSSGIDWFDVTTVISYGDLEVSLSEVRKAIKHRQGYVKLPDGTMGLLPEELLAQYRLIFSMGHETEQGVRMSKTQATLLELTLKNTDAVTDEEYKRRIEQLKNFTQIESHPLPANFTGELRHYQHEGFNWLYFLHDYGFGGCLADDMGIGKTVQALVFLQSLIATGHTKSASLIVMPRSILENWAREAARFTPDLKVMIHAENDRSDSHTSFDGYHLVLTTYGIMLRDVELFKKYKFHYIVLDEAQVVKNAVSLSARASRLLHCEHRLALTGTPVENSTEELWSLFAFLNPGQLGTQNAFREQFAIPIQRYQNEKAAQMLRALVHPFILRRTKEQVAPELPPRTERLIYCEMAPAQRKLYESTRDKYRAELMGLINKSGMQQAKLKVLEGLLRLRQLANDPRLVDKTYVGESSKFEAILDAMEILREEGHKALVFSQFTSMLKLLRTSMDERKWPYLYLDGKTKNRQEMVDNFQADENIPFFLISLKAGGTGLNLTAADYVIHIDPWWNPAVERQATDRTHRIGQERPVMVYKFIAEDTVEKKILLLQEKKQALVDQLVSTESGLMKSLTKEDVAALFM